MSVQLKTYDPLDNFWVEEILWRITHGFLVGKTDDGWVYNRCKNHGTAANTAVKSLLKRGLLDRSRIDGFEILSERWWPGSKRGSYWVIDPVAGRELVVGEIEIMKHLANDLDARVFRKGAAGDWVIGYPAGEIEVDAIKTVLRRGYVYIDGNLLKITSRGRRALGAHFGRSLARARYRRPLKAAAHNTLGENASVSATKRTGKGA